MIDRRFEHADLLLRWCRTLPEHGLTFGDWLVMEAGSRASQEDAGDRVEEIERNA